MIKGLKFELFKLLRSKFLLFTFIIIFVYSLLVNLLYYMDDVTILYQAFTEEYLILYLCLSIFYASYIICEEFDYRTIDDTRKKEVLFSKILLNILLLLITLIFSIIICYDLSLIIFKLPYIELDIFLNIFKTFFKILPMIIILNLLTMIFSLIFLKSNMAIGLTFIFYFMFSYINHFIVSKQITSLYLWFTLHWNFNNLELQDIILPKLSILINGIWITILLIILSMLFFKQKKN